MGITRLRLDGVSLSMTSTGGEAVILNDITCELKRGEVTIVTGATGAGKTSLIMLLAAISRPSAGTLWADDSPVSRWQAPHRDRWRRGVGLAFQRGYLLEDLTVQENIALPLIPRGLVMAKLARAVADAAKELGLETLVRKRARELSGGERQRVGVARALVHRPEILLLDEPTAHQDGVGLSLVLEAVARRRETSITVLATHDARVIESEVADRCLRIGGASLVDTTLGASS
jgi:ABC-type lipoprotein export system ATPase subunit